MASRKRALISAALAAASLFALGCWTSASSAPSETVAVRLIAINDLHGHLEPGENAIEVRDPSDPSRTVALRSGGVAHVATLIARLRSEQAHSLVVSSGDLIGASPLTSGLFRDEPTIEAMNAIGLDIGVVGNHEFDRGVTELKRIAHGGCATENSDQRRSCANGTYAGARFDLLAANVIERATEQPLFAANVVKSFDGVRVGFVGVVTRSTPGIVVPSGVAGVRFLPEARVLNEQAEALQRSGVQAIVAILHEGGDADGGFNSCQNPRGAIFDIARELHPAINVVLSAHTHRGYNCDVGGRVVIQGASFGRLVSVVDIQMDRATGHIINSATRARNVPVPNGTDANTKLAQAFPPLPAEPAVAAIVQHYRDAAAPLADRAVGRISAVFLRRADAGGDHALGRLIADAQLAATRDRGARLALTNPGGVRTALSASGPNGTVTYADAYAVQPFGNSLVTMTLTGAQLRTLLEQQWSANGDRARMLQPSDGFNYEWDARKPRGSRIGSIRLDGVPLREDVDVRLTVNSFLAAGGDGFHILREGRDRVGGALDIDAFTAYLAARSSPGPLSPSTSPRIRRTN